MNVTVMLILFLLLPGYDKPERGQIAMPDLETCQARAALFLETARVEIQDEGGHVMAGCAVVLPPRQPS